MNGKVGQNLSFYRKRAKLSQKQIAKEINKSESTIRKYESGLIEPPISVLKDISKILGITVEDLLSDVPNTLGQKIVEIRRKQGIKQIDLARMMGTAPSTVANYENNLRLPDFKNTLKLAEALQIPVSELLNTSMEKEDEEKVHEINCQKLTAIELKTLIDNATNELLRRIENGGIKYE